MARNGSGTYALPNDALVAGEISSVVDYNSTMDDLATALTNSLAKDGQTTTTARIGFASGISTDTIIEVTPATGVTIDSVLLKDNTVLAGTMTIAAGSITDSSGAISFGNENLTTTGTLAAGATTLTGNLFMGGNDIISDGGAANNFVLSGGANGSLGANIVLYSDTHAVVPGGFIVRNSADTTLSWSVASAAWNFQANAITTTGTLAAGATTITGALTISGASAGQIVFPATQNASANVNTLDDYQEGSWTPTLQDTSNSDAEGQAYDHQVGRYIKIGRQVTCIGSFSINDIGTLTPSSAARIGGLPFAAENVTNLFGVLKVAYATGMSITAGQHVSGYVNPNSTQLNLALWDATTGISFLQISEFFGSNPANIGFEITYFTDN